tara:strand:+ start:1849 stop:2130 length:282 start_codon:yes stop_codon:yes gene_type:complete
MYTIALTMIYSSPRQSLKRLGGITMDKIVYDGFSSCYGKPWSIHRNGYPIAHFSGKRKAQQYLKELILTKYKEVDELHYGKHSIRFVGKEKIQ